MKRLRTAAILALLGTGCFDPLYEDPDPLGEVTWAVCCVSGQVDTCPCDASDGCPSTFRACAAGTCAESLSQSCYSSDQDAGAAGTWDSGTSTGTDAGMVDAGMPMDGGISTDGGTGTDGGISTDAGPAPDAGTQPGDIGYAPCCDPANHQVTTCACPASGCSNPPFTPCASGRCALTGERCG
ncbi:hypothetical protein [Corallococcus sicarius]|uniref:hypothetical protein n=1 Tax=Corallococcus sicarius TaxID=2316726 RepID=UPI0011C4A0D6|nr:hypothetical protein [Corallococcus sicarius]